MQTITAKLIEGEEAQNRRKIEKAAAILKDGGLVAFPTETVYGLGADALNPAAAGRIYQAKGRPSDNPLIVHISCMKDLEKIAARVPLQAKKLAEHFWIGRAHV